MPRSLASRFLAALCAFWLAVALPAMSALHACPAHGDHGAGHAGWRVAGGAHASHHAGMTSTEHGRLSSHDMPMPNGPSHACTCIGSCGLSVAVVVPTAPTLASSHAGTPVGRMETPRAFGWHPDAVAHARPPSIGPPRFTA